MSAVDTDLTVQISISLRQRFSEHLFCNVIILTLMKQNDHWVKEKVHLKTHKNSQPLQSALRNKSSRRFKNHEKLFLIPSKIIIKELIFINLQTRSLENELLEKYILITLTACTLLWGEPEVTLDKRGETVWHYWYKKIDKIQMMAKLSTR